MSSTDIRVRNRNNAIHSIANVNLNDADPTNNQALVYNATTQYMEPTDVVVASATTTISGNKVFTGGVQIDANGSVIRDLRFETIDFGVIAGSARPTMDVFFSPQFNSVPIVMATIQAGVSDLSKTVNIEDLTTSGCTVSVSNFIVNPSSTNVLVHLLIMEI